MYQATAIQQYQNIGLESGFMGASPHRTVTLLLEGAIEKLARAKACARMKKRAELGESVSRVLAIIGILRSSLNQDKGGQISENLLALYDYMENRLLDASFSADIEIFEEVSSLIAEIAEGWRGIGHQALADLT